MAIVPFPVVFALLAQVIYWVTHPEISTVSALASILGALSAVLLTTSFALIVSLRVRTVRAATHITLFLIVPLLLLVQLGHEAFLSGLFVSVTTLAISVLLTILATVMSMRKFASL